MKNNPLEKIIDGVADLKSLGSKADKLAKKFLDEHKDDGAKGVAMIVFGEIGSACAMSLCKSKMDDKDALRLIRDQMDELEEGLEEKENIEDEDDEDEGSEDNPFETPQGKMILAMLKQGALGKDGMPTNKLIKKALKKFNESPERFSKMTDLDRHSFINELLGSPLTKSELKALARDFKEQDDDDED